MDLSPSPFPSLSSEVSIVQDSTGSLSVRDSPNRELESVVPCIILEPEEEEKEMAPNLRTGFNERHRKRLSEALLIALLPAKKIHPEASREESISDSPTAQVPPSDTVRSGQKLVASSFVERNACPGRR